MHPPEALRAALDTRRIPNQSLRKLRQLALDGRLAKASKLAEWLYHWAETEEHWRATDPDNRPLRHCLAFPPCNEWADGEVADALRAAVALTFATMSASLGEFIDRVYAAVAIAAAERLAPDEADDAEIR